MTGEEYWSLKRGSIITVETSFYKHERGQVLKVEYINDNQQVAYLRDVSKPLGSQIDIVSVIFLLDNFIVGGELPEKKNNKVIELPFALGDKVWFLYNNTVYDGKIIDCCAQIDGDGINIKYKLLSSRWGENAVTLTSNKLFKTKEELLKSL